MQEACSLIGIHKSHTTAYHPQCDGQVDRKNHTLQELIDAFVSEHNDYWDRWVSLAFYAYSTSCNASTGFSPYELVFRCSPRTHPELGLEVPFKHPCSQPEYSQSIRKVLHSLKHKVTANLH